MQSYWRLRSQSWERGLDKFNRCATIWWEIGKSGRIPLTNQSHSYKGIKWQI
jgi:hypothetical protein